VVTVCRDAEAIIDRALRSVAGQVDSKGHPYLDYEHVIVDGGSRDGTVSRVEEYARTQAERGVKVKVLSEPDEGIYDAMNKGLALAEGHLIAFLNADDWYASRALATVHAIVYDIERAMEEERCLEPLATSHGDVAATTPLDCIGGASKIVDVRESTVHVRPVHPALLVERYPTEMPVHHQALFIRTDLLREMGGFDTRFRIAADYDLCLRLMAREDVRWVYTDKVLSHFTLGGVSTHPTATARDYHAVRLANGWPPVYAAALRIKNSLAATLRRARSA
jgi:glycosyltransferase involved in cell wall biosynthesis